MKEIKVSDVKNLSYISVNNDEIWKELGNIAKGLEEDVLFDFRGIELTEPWKNLEFPRFLGLNNVYMKIYYADETKKDIDLICKLNKYPTNKVINVENVKTEELPVDDIEWDKVERMQKVIEDDTVKRLSDTEALINYGSRFDYAEKTETILGLGEAIKKLRADGVTKITLNFKDVGVQTEKISELYEVLKDGLLANEIEIVDLDDKVADTIGILLSVDKGDLKVDMSRKEKIKILLEELKPGTVGILAKYAGGKTKDKVSKLGTGTAVWSKVAIFKGIQGDNVIFDAFVGKYFHSKEYKLSEGMVDQGLRSQTITVDVSLLGFWDKFMGGEYFFNYPVQFNREETIEEIVQIEENGDRQTRELILPEFIKLVLDQYGYPYNKESLEEAIEVSMKEISKCK